MKFSVYQHEMQSGFFFVGVAVVIKTCMASFEEILCALE